MIVIPPDGYMTIPEETVEKLAQIMVQHELEMKSTAVKFAVEGTRANDKFSGAEFAHLLYQRVDLAS